jgi:uncharacterized secreted protein with C-terminal beta-propeller domain
MKERDLLKKALSGDMPDTERIKRGIMAERPSKLLRISRVCVPVAAVAVLVLSIVVGRGMIQNRQAASTVAPTQAQAPTQAPTQPVTTDDTKLIITHNGSTVAEVPIADINTAKTANATAAPTSIPGAASQASDIAKVGSYANLLSLFDEMGLLNYGSRQGLIDRVYSEAEADYSNGAKDIGTSIPAAQAVADAALGGMDTPAEMPVPIPDAEESGVSASSETNTQVKGVDEADVIKNDGKYIYYLHDSKVAIFDAISSPDNPQLISTITLPRENNAYWNDLYFSGDKLVVAGQTSRAYDTEGNPLDTDGNGNWIIEGIKEILGSGNYYYKDFTQFSVYDLSDRTAPTLLRTVAVDGYAVSTRMIGSTLYVVTNKYINTYYNTDGTQPDISILPSYSDSAVSDDTRVIGPEDISYFPGDKSAQYLLVGAFDVNTDESFVPEAFLGCGTTIYMTMNSLYISNVEYGNSGLIPRGLIIDDAIAPNSTGAAYSSTTILHRFAVDGAQLTYVGKATIPGNLYNQYAMDEYNGILRAAITDWNAGNGIITIDTATMEIIGSIEGLAQGETLYGVRFIGNTGYIVTYRQTDPLFVIDLTDPTHPTLKGELHIPGFSQYLHPFGANYLIGFGRETQELYYKDDKGNEVTTGSVQDVGFKLSLFDISNPLAPKEVAKEVFTNAYSDASYNPRSIMADAANGIFAFPMESYNANNYQSIGAVIKVDDTGFTQLAKVNPSSGDYVYNSRFVYINDRLYYVTSNSISVLTYPDAQELGAYKY